MTFFFGTVLPWLLIAVGTWLGYQIVRQNGRILHRLDSIERQFRSLPEPARQTRETSGLKVGTAAPDFDLPRLTEGRQTLSDLRGRDVLLIFFNPRCGFCAKMADALAALPTAPGDGGAVPIIITTGETGENKRFVEAHGIRCMVLLQTGMDVASQYRAQGTPMGYRIDAAGKIASELAVGAEPLLQLAVAPAVPATPQKQPKSRSQAREPGYASLERSRLKRDGLKAGDSAPDFRLPRIDGGELALADLRGERVLLVFSDPECGPCDQLAPQLQRIHEHRSDVNVLMISRKDVEANVAKATRLGLTFPIVLQKRWEVSLQYAMFATPIGYLIDERGLLLRDVAVGIEPILALLENPAQSEIESPQPSLTAQETASTT